MSEALLNTTSAAQPFEATEGSSLLSAISSTYLAATFALRAAADPPSASASDASALDTFTSAASPSDASALVGFAQSVNARVAQLSQVLPHCFALPHRSALPHCNARVAQLSQVLPRGALLCLTVTATASL